MTDAPDVDDQRDGGRRQVEAEHVDPRPRQLPEAEPVVAVEGEERESRRVENDKRGSNTGRSANARRRSASPPAPPIAATSGVLQRDRHIDRERDQRRARRPRQACRQRSPLKSGRHFHACARSPESAVTLFPRGSRAESQARVAAAGRAPHKAVNVSERSPIDGCRTKDGSRWPSWPLLASSTLSRRRTAVPGEKAETPSRRSSAATSPARPACWRRTAFA